MNHLLSLSHKYDVKINNIDPATSYATLYFLEKGCNTNVNKNNKIVFSQEEKSVINQSIKPDKVLDAKTGVTSKYRQ